MAALDDAARQKVLEIDEDAILGGMTEEELERLNYELMELDPDNNALPAGQRQPDQTKKAPTGDYNPDALRQFLIEQAQNTEDVDELVPFEAGKKRGKAYVAKNQVVQEDGFGGGEISLDKEIQDALANASELELTDLAAVLGLYKMIDNEQFYNAQANPDKITSTISFNQATKCKLPVMAPEELAQMEANSTDPYEMLGLVKANDASVDEVNLNNIGDISNETLQDYGTALATNSNLKKLSLVGTKMTDTALEAFAESLKSNKTLEELNLETNYLTANGVASLISALNENPDSALRDIKVDNQKQNFGTGGEEKVACQLQENKTICKFSYQFRNPGARHRAVAATTRNTDTLVRKNRVKK